MNLLQRHLEIVALRNRGVTLDDIGERFNISHQRVYQIYKQIPQPWVKKKCSLCDTEFKTNDRKRVGCSSCQKMKSSVSGREYTRLVVRIRDNFTCQDCGSIRTFAEAKKNKTKMFDVHHLNGFCGKKSRSYDRMEDIDGLITLCHKCHYNRPEHRVKSSSFKK